MWPHLPGAQVPVCFYWKLILLYIFIFYQWAIRIFFSHFINNKMTFPNKKWEQRSSVTPSLHHGWLIAYLSSAPSHSLLFFSSLNLYFSLCFHISLSFNTLVYFILSFSASSKQTHLCKEQVDGVTSPFLSTSHVFLQETQLFEFKSQFLFWQFQSFWQCSRFSPIKKTSNELAALCYLCGQSLV